MSEHYNLEFGKFSGVGKFSMPEILPVYEMEYPEKWIEFDYAYRNHAKRSKTGIHFYERDYKFARVWNTPNKYLNLLSEYSCVLSPDFSVYADYPMPIQIYNYYRNCWCARFWQNHQITVIPTVIWGTKDTYDFCFDGLPKNSIVSVSTVGNMKGADNKEFWLNGYNEMLNRLNPREILVFSRDFTHNLDGNVHWVKWELFKGVQNGESI